MISKTSAATIIAASTLALCAACGSAATTNELRAARSAYAQARNSEAAELDPAGVQAAHDALQIAERAHEKDAGSGAERDHAYIAARKAELAVARASAALAIAEQQRARQSYEQVLERRRSEQLREPAGVAPPAGHTPRIPGALPSPDAPTGADEGRPTIPSSDTPAQPAPGTLTPE